MKEIFDLIANAIETIENEEALTVLKRLSTIKLIYKLKTIIQLLDVFKGEHNYSDAFIVLRKYEGIEIDMFIINNVLFY